jgi:hypothetical protein
MTHNKYNKIYIIQFSTLSTEYWRNEKYTEASLNIEFLGLQINMHLNVKNHIDQVIPKLCAACNPSQTSLVFGCMYLWLLCLHLLGTIWMYVSVVAVFTSAENNLDDGAR